ncbi:lysophospholipid acyltransferase family protein [Paraburkholderia rhynchosiae]|uniref:Lauroyl/myristoyl acyltransferase n=1 Tax=Paraburkholderia rhynchosiae TaxID=487049 RepID=A0A2N7WU77_9BURK|nr:hypothetical protein [Paraburkholderia rhynchosiae]PMS32957.1 hypothetical protein C0Z16_05305 [Paraburkholderia rhynchosiae]CAB3644506.1 hypothetical protein LMG27174_00716 [Paraburkholderia rhynchosiae]
MKPWVVAWGLLTFLRKRLAHAKRGVQVVLIARMPRSAIEPLAAVLWRICGLVDARTGWEGVCRCEIGREVLELALSNPGRVAAGRFRERLIDQRIYFGRLSRGSETWSDLQQVASALARKIAQLQADEPGRPVIVSPFHYVSQYANIYVIDELRALLGLESIAVVSGVPRDLYGDDHSLIPGVNVLYTYGDDDRNGLGLRVARALRRNGVAVLFADVPPFALHRYPMETVSVSMFGRNARIHNGVFRLGAQFNAILLPFYLRFERGRFGAEIFNPLPLAGTGAVQQVARYIEQAAADNYSDWLVAGHPSMYSFAPVR